MRDGCIGQCACACVYVHVCVCVSVQGTWHNSSCRMFLWNCFLMSTSNIL